MDDFLAGVVEGFYGQPWTQTQRLELLDQMADWGLNTYFYSPKDDLKHRALWRETYNEAELDSLGSLIDACDQRQLIFIYGLSPGLDIRFTDSAEVLAIQRRFQQLVEVGARHFALLFDDLPGELTVDDRNGYDSVAAAHAAITNSVLDWLRDQFAESRLLFCPTPYCDRMDRWHLGGSNYLDAIGDRLHSNIDVLWTGPEIISREIDATSIRLLSDRIQRPPVIWDNLHANDYDLRRLYCGPYVGRSPDLLQVTRGILSNPNNEFPINYVPLRSLADFIRQAGEYDPRQAYLSAISEWATSYATVKSCVELDDLILLADCYYLPFNEGAEAEKLHDVVRRLVEQPVDTWGDAYEQFLGAYQRVLRIFEKLTELKRRELFYAWSRRVWELREELELIHEFLERKKNGDADESAGVDSETHLPMTYRGGMVARLQRLLTMDEHGRFRRSSFVRGS